MTDYHIKQIALKIYQEENQKKLQQEKEQAIINQKKDIQQRISYELEELRKGSNPPPKDDITILKEQQKTLSSESKKLQQLRKTLEESLKEVRNKMAIIYEARYQAKERFAKVEKENDPLLNESKRLAFIELQEKEEKAGIVWSEEKILENKISELIAKELQIESDMKNLRNQQRQKEQELDKILRSI